MFWQDLRHHIERLLAPSCGQKRRDGYITNQSQLLKFFRKMEKARSTIDGRGQSIQALEKQALRLPHTAAP